MAGRRPIALLLGSASRDLDLAAPDAPATPGGTVFHAGLALAGLGAVTRVVTRVATRDTEALLRPLQTAGVLVRALPSRRTTTYANDYRPAAEQHALRATSDPLELDDVPAAWRAADVIQLGPLHHDDLHPALAASLHGLRGLDLQGLVRAPAGRAAVAGDLARRLAGMPVVQASEHELPLAAAGESPAAFRRRHAIRELIVTRGARGACVLTAAGETAVPATSSSGRFPAGAGDVFLAVYLLARWYGRPVAEAAHAAARATAHRISDGVMPRRVAGLPSFGRPG